MKKQSQPEDKRSKREKREAIRAIARHFWFYKRYVIPGIIILIVVDAVQLIKPQIIKRLIDGMTSGTLGLSDVPVFALAILSIGLTVAGCRFLWRLFLVVTSERISEMVRGRLFTHLLTLSQRFFHTKKTGDLMAHLSNDTEAVRVACAFGVILLIDGFLMAGAAIAIMIRENARLTLYALIPLPLLSLVVTTFGRAMHARFEAVQASFSEMTETIRDAFSGVRVVKTFVQEEGQLDGVRSVSQQYMDKNMHLVRIWGAFFPLIMLLAGVSMAIVFWKGGTDVIQGRMSVGTFVAVADYLLMLTWPMMALGWLINLIQRGSASMVRINRIMNVTPEIVDDANPVEPDSLSGRIELKDLTFSYREELEPALKSVSFDIEQGKTVAIVGRTGSGKSTLVRLLLREFDPPAGTIFIDGIDVRKLRISRLRRLFGYVPQDSFLFGENISYNIAFGQAQADEARIREFAAMSAIDRDVREFPDGYDTIVGERGVMLSGGQKQRVAIARALINEPKIVLLDDCLSAVDTKTEAQILGNLKDAIRDVTTIIVSHRLSAVQLADEIIVLDEGEVKERGTHRGLLKEGGIYAALFARQQIEERLARDS